MKTLLALSLVANIVLIGLLVARSTTSRDVDEEDALAFASTDSAVETPEMDREPAGLREVIVQGEPYRPSVVRVRSEASVTPESIGEVEIGALPGLERFDVSNPMLAAENHPAVLLAAEDKDPGWAVNMESAMLAKIQQVDSGPLNLLEIECRTTWCGMVVDLPFGEDRNERMQVANLLRDDLGFTRISRFGFGRGDGSSYFAVYFQMER